MAIGSFRAEAGLWTWLYRITVNECLRRKKRLAPLSQVDAETDSGGADAAVRIEGQLVVRHALDSLARKRGQRTVTDVLDEVSDDLLPWWNRA